MADKPKTTRTNTTKTTDVPFASFLKKHSLSGDKVRGILTDCGVNSLYELLAIKKDAQLLADLKAKLTAEKHLIAVTALDQLEEEAIAIALQLTVVPTPSLNKTL